MSTDTPTPRTSDRQRELVAIHGDNYLALWAATVKDAAALEREHEALLKRLEELAKHDLLGGEYELRDIIDDARTP